MNTFRLNNRRRIQTKLGSGYFTEYDKPPNAMRENSKFSSGMPQFSSAIVFNTDDSQRNDETSMEEDIPEIMSGRIGVNESSRSDVEMGCCSYKR